MGKFEVANKFTSEWEKGKVDHPNDPGGVTNMGVSFRFLEEIKESDYHWFSSIGVQMPPTREVILSLSRSQVDSVFKRYFWDKAHCEEFGQAIATCLYDCSVNSGIGRAAILLQEAINKLSPKAIDKLAANVGPLTRRYVKQLCIEGKEGDLCEKYISNRENFYKNLAKSNPRFKVFLKGWLNRTNDLRMYVDKLVQ